MGIPIRKKICNGCNKEKYIWARGMCKRCDGLTSKRGNAISSKRVEMEQGILIENEEIFMQPRPKSFLRKSPIKKFGIKPKFKTNSGQLIVFQMIWNETPEEERICCVCGNFLQFSPHVFSHILGKGAYPKFKLLKQNIKLMCFDINGDGCHNKWDTKAKSDLKKDIRWKPIFELEEILKQKYYQNNE